MQHLTTLSDRARTEAELLLDRLEHEEDGQTTAEYAGIIVLIALIMAAIFGLGLDSTISSAISEAVSTILGG